MPQTYGFGIFRKGKSLDFCCFHLSKSLTINLSSLYHDFGEFSWKADRLYISMARTNVMVGVLDRPYYRGKVLVCDKLQIPFLMYIIQLPSFDSAFRKDNIYYYKSGESVTISLFREISHSQLFKFTLLHTFNLSLIFSRCG